MMIGGHRPRHTLLITLGSNYEAEVHLPYALERIYEHLFLLAQTAIVETEPVDFPYPSPPFCNTVLLCRTRQPLEQVQEWLHGLELCCGRTPECRDRHPERIALDADLIAWDSLLLKPRDLQRPYLSEGLVSLSLPIEELRLRGLEGIDI